MDRKILVAEPFFVLAKGEKDETKINHYWNLFCVRSRIDSGLHRRVHQGPYSAERMQSLGNRFFKRILLTCQSFL